MTAMQAYQLLNVRPGASLAEIEQAYLAALKVLQLQMVPGQPVGLRQKAQSRIAELKSAFEFLKNTAGAATPPTAASGYAQPAYASGGVPQLQPMPMPPAVFPQAQPGTGMPIQPTGPVPAGLGMAPAAPSYPWILPASFALAAAVMLLVVVLCVGPSISLERQKTARLRVLSVPWSYVEVDGKSLGPSGQVDAFALRPGDHEVVLRRGDRVLSRTVHLLENSETVIKAQLEKGQIDVANKRIRFALQHESKSETSPDTEASWVPVRSGRCLYSAAGCWLLAGVACRGRYRRIVAICPCERG